MAAHIVVILNTVICVQQKPDTVPVLAQIYHLNINGVWSVDVCIL